jgi:S1-C subfamily serine protease
VDALDVVLLVIAALAAAHGLRVGAAVQLVSFAGFLAGLAIGVVLILLIEPHLSGQLVKTFVALILLVVPATVVGGAGRQLGFGAWQALRRVRFGAADSALGAVFAVAATMIVCWLFASILVNSAYQGVSNQIERSKIIQGVERVMPPVPDSFATVERYLSADGFPQVLVNVIPGSLGAVTLPSATEVRSAVGAASASTVKVVAIGCGLEQEGSGFVAHTSDGSDLVVTNAHVVAGTKSITVEAPDGTSAPATPVLFDPRFDLAVLRTSPLGEPALSIDPSYVERGASAVVLGYPGGGSFTYRPAGVVARFAAEGRDIYDTALTVRTVYELRAIVRPGNSGGPLVSPSGQVLGVVFSRSASNPDVGFALASPGVLARVDTALEHPGNPGTESCTS